MKKLLITLLVALCALPAAADEGMWLPSLISSRIKDMRAKGFRLTADDIYSINRASMKDAVVLFGGGCTGEIVSEEGLLLTNHHCGYGAIADHSTVGHDYLTHGFWARSRAEELPNERLNVRILVRMEEVTDRLAAGEKADEILAAARAEGPVIVLLIGVCVWGIFGRLDTKISTAGTCENGVFTCYVTEEKAAKIKSGMQLNVDGNELSVSGISSKPVSVNAEMDEYLLYLGGFSEGDWLYEITANGALADGIYKAEIVMESVSPMSFILN